MKYGVDRLELHAQQRRKAGGTPRSRRNGRLCFRYTALTYSVQHGGVGEVTIPQTRCLYQVPTVCRFKFCQSLHRLDDDTDLRRGRLNSALSEPGLDRMRTSTATFTRKPAANKPSPRFCTAGRVPRRDQTASVARAKSRCRSSRVGIDKPTRAWPDPPICAQNS